MSRPSQDPYGFKTTRRHPNQFHRFYAAAAMAFSGLFLAQALWVLPWTLSRSLLPSQAWMQVARSSAPDLTDCDWASPSARCRAEGPRELSEVPDIASPEDSWQDAPLPRSVLKAMAETHAEKLVSAPDDPFNIAVMHTEQRNRAFQERVLLDQLILGALRARPDNAARSEALSRLVPDIEARVARGQGAYDAAHREGVVREREAQVATWEAGMADFRRQITTRIVFVERATFAGRLLFSMLALCCFALGVRAWRRYRPPLRIRIGPHTVEVQGRRLLLEDLVVVDGVAGTPDGVGVVPLWEAGYQTQEAEKVLVQAVRTARQGADRNDERTRLRRLTE